MSDSLTTSDTFIAPAKGQAAPSQDTVLVPASAGIPTSDPGPQPGTIARRWTPDLDQIEKDIEQAVAMLPGVDDPPPLVKDFESPVFWTTTVLPIALAITAYVFHHDLSSQAVSFAGLGAAITTLGYTLYRGVYRHAHSVALTTASAIRSGQVRDAVALATTGHLSV